MGTGHEIDTIAMQDDYTLVRFDPCGLLLAIGVFEARSQERGCS
jgi:hypothetical protein